MGVVEDGNDDRDSYFVSKLPNYLVDVYSFHKCRIVVALVS